MSLFRPVTKNGGLSVLLQTNYRPLKIGFEQKKPPQRAAKSFKVRGLDICDPVEFRVCISRIPNWKNPSRL